MAGVAYAAAEFLAAAFTGEAAAGAAGAVIGDVSAATAAGVATHAAAGAALAAGGKLLSSPLGASVAGAATSALLTGQPKTPGVRPPVTMPDPLQQQDARRKAIAQQYGMRGRASTILTDSAVDKLG